MFSSFTAALLQFVSPSSSTTSQQNISKQIHRRSFFANLILLLGYIFGAWFQIYEFQDRDRELIAITVYFLAFALLIISGVVELSVDIFSVRTVGHGRYHSGSPIWNRFISLLFISIAVIDIVAFVCWIERDFYTEDILLICSAYIIYVMSVLVLFFQTNDPIEGIPDRVDLAANILIFVNSCPNIVLRHLDFSAVDYDDTVKRMELAVVILFLISALLYVSADMIRVKTTSAVSESHRSLDV